MYQFYGILFVLFTILASVANSLMDTIKHHKGYKTVFWRRFGWHKEPKNSFKYKFYKFLIETGGTFEVMGIKILSDSHDGWHWLKRLMIVSLLLAGVFLSLMIEGSNGDWFDYFILTILFFNAIWCFVFLKLYDKWWVHRERVGSQWMEYYKKDGTKTYLNNNIDPYK